MVIQGVEASTGYRQRFRAASTQFYFKQEQLVCNQRKESMNNSQPANSKNPYICYAIHMPFLLSKYLGPVNKNIRNLLNP